MKTLQSNYTTPEQSKRLLELGLPADSADCYLQRRFGTDQWSEEKQFIPHDKLYSQWCTSRVQLPCWPVGRLIEIELTCREQREGQVARLIFNAEDMPSDLSSTNIVESLVAYMERGKFKYDFSKLND